MSAVVAEIVFITILILANGLFAMAEAAVISARKARLQRRAEAGDEKARAAIALVNAPGNFLATVQIGITLIGILAGAFGGATIAEQLAAALSSIPALAPYSEAIGLATVVVAITYFSLVIGELVPKNLALNDPERIAAAVARPMQRLSKVVSPVVRLLHVSTTLVLKILGIQPSDEPAVTEEEIKVMIEQGTEVGVFHHVESEIVREIFRLNDLRVETVSTPRTEIVWFDIGDAAESARQMIEQSGHSRYPVAEGSLDNVLGVVHVKDLLTRQLAGEPFDLKTSMHPPLFIPESTSVLKAFEAMWGKGEHLALILDEYGGLHGLVTQSDLLREFAPDAVVKDSLGEALYIERPDGSWLLDGMLPIDKLKEILQIKALPDEDEGHYQTLGGLVMAQIGHVPVSAEHFELGGFRFEIVDMDGYRVDKVLVVPL